MNFEAWGTPAQRPNTRRKLLEAPTCKPLGVQESTPLTCCASCFHLVTLSFSEGLSNVQCCCWTKRRCTGLCDTPLALRTLQEEQRSWCVGVTTSCGQESSYGSILIKMRKESWWAQCESGLLQRSRLVWHKSLPSYGPSPCSARLSDIPYIWRIEKAIDWKAAPRQTKACCLAWGHMQKLVSRPIGTDNASASIQS